MIDVPNAEFRPGCFGLAMTYREGTRECGACPFAIDCAPLATQSLARLRADLGIIAPAKPLMVNRRTIARKDPNVIIEQPPALSDSIAKLKAAIVPSLSQNVNPFAKSGPTFLKIAIHTLLKLRQRGVFRQELVACFVEKLGYTEDKAQAHVNQVVKLLVTVGAGAESNNIIQLKDNLYGL